MIQSDLEIIKLARIAFVHNDIYTDWFFRAAFDIFKSFSVSFDRSIIQSGKSSDTTSLAGVDDDVGIAHQKHRGCNDRISDTHGVSKRCLNFF
ncbi:hypothetical protein D3C72_1615310 [compost metagenome]